MDSTIARAIAGDHDAITALYTRYDLQLRRYLANRVDADDIEDVLSQVWLQVLRALPRYEDRGWPFSAWLYRIAQSRAVDFRRAQQRRPSLPLLDCHAIDGPERQIDTWDAHAALPQLLAALVTPEQRAVIVRRFLLDQSVDEVAAAMGLSVGAVKALQHRALGAMRHACADSGRPAVPLHGGPCGGARGAPGLSTVAGVGEVREQVFS